ncbi:MAG: MBL fold metallo-hydrolase [Polyangia bacterium]
MNKTLALALVLAATPALADRPAYDDSKVAIKTTKLAPGFAELEGTGGNVGVWYGDDGVFVIDDDYASLAPKIKAAIAALTPKPVRFLFNTHWHSDHTGGNAQMGTAGALIIAQDSVRKRLTSDQVIAVFHATIPASPPKALPVVTFLDEMTFYLNGDELHVIHLEHAHTDGDSIIHFKKTNLVQTGDTFFTAGYPFIDVGSGGSIGGYVVAANRIAALCDDKTQVVPGHGPVSNKVGVLAWRDMLTKVRDRVAKLKAQKKTLEQIIATKPTAEFDAKWGAGMIKPDLFVTTVYETVATPKR